MLTDRSVLLLAEAWAHQPTAKPGHAIRIFGDYLAHSSQFRVLQVTHDQPPKRCDYTTALLSQQLVRSK